MGGGFEELGGITADVGIRAWGDTPSQAFAQAALGLASLLSDRALLLPRQTRSLLVRSPDREGALVDFLNEIVFLAESGAFLPLEVPSLSLRRARGEWEVEAVLEGEPFDPARHRRLAEVKAATWHRLAILPPEGEGPTEVTVIFDV